MDFASLMIHELGHVPGMAHFDLSDRMRLASQQNSSNLASKRENSRFRKEIHSVMEPKLAEGSARRDIAEHDLDNLLCAYLNL